MNGENSAQQNPPIAFLLLVIFYPMNKNTTLVIKLLLASSYKTKVLFTPAYLNLTTSTHSRSH